MSINADIDDEEVSILSSDDEEESDKDSNVNTQSSTSSIIDDVDLVNSGPKDTSYTNEMDNFINQLSTNAVVKRTLLVY